MSIKVIVKVIAKVPVSSLPVEDRLVARNYEIVLNDCIGDDLIADAALDQFHSTVAITDPGCFEYEIWHHDEQCFSDPNHDAYSLSGDSDLA